MSPLTRGCDSILPGGLVVAQGEQQGLDGSDEDSSQASVENDIEQDNFDCGGGKKKERIRQLSKWKRKRTKTRRIYSASSSILKLTLQDLHYIVTEVCFDARNWNFNPSI